MDQTEYEDMLNRIGKRFRELRQIQAHGTMRIVFVHGFPERIVFEISERYDSPSIHLTNKVE